MDLKSTFDDAFFEKLSKDDIFTMSAALSYYTALSLAPLLILAISSIELLGADFKTELIRQVQELVGSQAAEAIRMITQSAERRQDVRSLAGFFGLLTLMISAGGIFGQLRTSLNVVFDTTRLQQKQADRMSLWLSSMNYIKAKIFSMGMVLTFVFISIVSLLISSFLTVIFQGVALVVGQVVNFFISLLIFTLLFSAIYYFLPEKKMRKKMSFIAGAITSLLFSIGKFAIGLYLGQSAVGSSYGAAGSMIVLLMWVYFSSLIIFLSAEVSYQMEKVFLSAKDISFT